MNAPANIQSDNMTSLLRLLSATMATLRVPDVFEDPKDLARAAFAWRYLLAPKEVRLIERWCHGDLDADAMNAAGVSKAEIDKIKPRIFAAMETTNVKKVCAIAGRFGLGPDL